MNARKLKQIFKDTDYVHRSGTPEELRVAEYLRARCEELGAAAVITRRREELSACGLVIAPRPVREPLPLREKAVVLTAGKPLVPLNGTVLWRYHFKMPDGFADIKPEELSEEYFCSALYTLGSQFELGSIVPLSAQGERGSCDAKALAAILGANNRD